VQPLIATWTSLDLRRRGIVIAATLAMFAAILGLTRMSGAPGMALLYSGLDGAAAGEVVAALEAQGVAFEVQGDSIRVPAAQRDALRMTLAAEGLPAAGSQGYELLDGLTGFGTTAQMFDAAYWRAKEGELARTILSVPGLRAARVHIARAPAAPFRDDARATASVTVTSVNGSIDADRAQALRHLVAAAVSGLRPEDVAVIDSAGGLVPLPDGGPGTAAGADTRAAALKANVERLLAARVGPDRAAVEVAVDLVTAREQVTERRFDPTGRVAISTETEEKSDNSTEGAGDVTVASNLPDGDAAAQGGDRSQSSQTRERTNFEVSETQTEILRLPGDIRRITVAVLVDDEVTVAADGTVTSTPRPEEELAALRELVASAVGLDEARGDVLTLKSMPFRAAPAEGTLVEAGLFDMVGPLDVMSLVQTGALALVALILGLFVLRPILAGSRTAALPPPSAPLALAPPETEAVSALTGEIADGPFAGPDETDPEEDPVVRLRRLIEERRGETVEILRGWMEREEKV
jgi:flagellar M-ring protein FliF